MRDNEAMTVLSPYVVELSEGQRAVLRARVRRVSGQHRDVLRAKIVLAAADRTPNAVIAGRLGITVDTVRKWRRRFCQQGLDGLNDLPRSGRPRRFTPVVVAEVKALACALPAETGTPLSRWSAPELARETVQRGIIDQVSPSTIRRWLAEDVLKPWQHRSWIFPRDPDFAVKAARVLDLYAGLWEGQPLSDNDFVVCADEKTSIQARCRCHPTLPPGQARMMRIEHEYARGGALAYLAAWDVHRGRVHGRCEPKTGIEPFGRLVEQVMTAEPYASAERVFWVVDNGSSHRGQAAADRLNEKWPNARLVHLPVHASWLDQIEIYFSVVQRKVVTPNDLTDLDAVARRLLDFQDRYNQTATPFSWKFTRNDLDALLDRIATHELDNPLPTAA
jgi:transposase